MYKWLMRVGFLLSMGGLAQFCGCKLPTCGPACSFGCPWSAKNILEAVVIGVLFD